MAEHTAQHLLDRHAQTRHLTEQATRLALLEQAQYYGALVALAADPNFDLVIRYLFQTRWLLREPTTLEDYGEERLLKQLLRDIRQAQERGALAADRGAAL